MKRSDQTVGQGIEHAFNGPIKAAADAHDVAPFDGRETIARDCIGADPHPFRQTLHVRSGAVDVMEFRLREAGAERADVDRMASILERERLRKFDQIRLRCGIKRVPGRRRKQDGE